MNTKYSCLIVGCGNIGVLNDIPGSENSHKTISFAKALKESGRFNLFFADKCPKKVNEAIRIWGGNPNMCEGYDVVIIATPDDTHCEMIMQYLSYKPKLIICEKPLCETAEQAEGIIKMCEEAGVPILLDYTRRFIPYWREIKRKYDAGDYGKLITANYFYNRGDLHTGSHITDFHNWMFGDKNGKIMHIHGADYRIWIMDLFFEKEFINEARIGDMLVPSYYDHHTKYVIENALEYLDEGKPLLCTMYDGLEALRLLEKL